MGMRFVQLVYAALYIATVIVFGVGALVLVGFALHELWTAISPASPDGLRARFDAVLECIGLATIAAFLMLVAAIKRLKP